MVSAASCPPLQKTQGRGTHSFGTGRKRPETPGHPSMGLLISSVVLFLFLHFLNSPAASTADAENGTMAANWSTDLRPAVGSPPLGLVVGRGHETRLQPTTSLWFVDNNTVVATFVTREETAALSNHDTNQPLRLRAIFLDVRTGKVASTQAWPSESRFAAIIAVHDGNFVTQRGDLLALYSPDAKEVRTLNLPSINKDLWGWFAHPSPTGRSILFATPNLTTTGQTPWIWVDATTLQIVRSWKEVQSGWIGISDSATAMLACSFPLYHCDSNLEIRGFTTEWKSITPIDRQLQSFPQFVNEDTIFMSGHPWKLLQSDGKMILIEARPFEGMTAVPSTSGQRFIVPFFQSKGGVTALDIGAHGELKAISVYDAPFHKCSYRLEVKGPKIKELAKLALSPDGSKLAILFDESLYLFQLPPALSTAHTQTPGFSAWTATDGWPSLWARRSHHGCGCPVLAFCARAGTMLSAR
jgi:hypothetical protein